MWSYAVTLPWWQAVAGLLGTVLVAGIVVRRSAARRSGGAVTDASTGAARRTGPADDAAAVLTQGLISAFDLASSSPTIRAHVQQVLRGVGVALLDAEPGTAFDPATHLAVETVPAAPGRSGQVARLVRPGWRRDGSVLRPAEVVVWMS